MPCFHSPKKLLPSKKSCKSFISTLNTRLRPFFTRGGTANTRSIQPHVYAPTVYVDRLFPTPATPAVAVIRHVETGDARGGGKGGGGKWKEYLESLPAVTVRGVDERAEEFIANFRREMMIQREQSLIDFQEMLARSI